MESKQSTKPNTSTTRLGRDLAMVGERVGLRRESESSRSGPEYEEAIAPSLDIFRPQFKMNVKLGPDKHDGRISSGADFTFISR